MKKIPNGPRENGTLRLTEENAIARIYETGTRLFAVNNRLILTVWNGTPFELNEAFIELFFKSNPDETKFTSNDVMTYRKFLVDAGVKINYHSKKQIKLSEKTSNPASITILPPTPEEQFERANILLASFREGHNDVFNELNALLKSLYENKNISKDEYEKVLKEIT